MIERPYWMERIRAGWRRRPIVWLAGVRRAGKTSLARMLGDVVYLNCDLPSTVRRLDDAETFYSDLPPHSTVVFDEVHRLADPSRALKIAADAFPTLRILATGCSTLAATGTFRDSLTGRKTIVHLPPVVWPECRAGFGLATLDHRLLHGGLPEPLLARSKDSSFFSEWLDSFYARDIQELFGIRQRAGFLKLLELMMRQSGGQADYSALSRECDLSRPTVKAHLEAMTVACALTPVPPFHDGGRSEIVKQPKIYAFDTGFVTFARGWDQIRDEDRGILWEHLAVDMLRAAAPDRPLFYWRNKAGHEVDFVMRGVRGAVDVFECKINPDRFDPKPLRVFRAQYPQGENYVLCPHVTQGCRRSVGPLTVKIVSCAEILQMNQCGTPGIRRAAAAGC